MMKNPSPEQAESPANFLHLLWQGWNYFWFTPADPTSLGFVRLCAGLVIFYVHLSYSFDLQALVGPDAWVDQETLQDFRENVPWQARSMTWNDMNSEKPTPRSPEEEKKIKNFMLKWDRANPNNVFDKGYYSWSIWFFVTDPFWIRAIHCAALLIFFLFTIGFCTRVTSVLAWLAALSYIQRAPTTLFGMDTIMNMVLLYLMIGPCGAALSVDRLILRYWRIWRALRPRGSRKSSGLSLPRSNDVEGERPEPQVSANLALRMLQINVCMIYFISGISKLQGTSWWNGTATWGTIANAEFSPVHMELYANFLYWLSNHRWAWELVMTSGVMFTLGFEIGFPTLVWNRWTRWLMILCAVAMHIAIAVCMGLTTFSLMMVSAVLSFVPQETLHRWLRNVGKGPGGMQLDFVARQRKQARAASLTHAFDVWNQIGLVDHALPRTRTSSETTEESNAIQKDSLAPWSSAASPEVERLQLVTEQGDILTGYALFERVVRRLRLLWPVALLTWVPGVGHLGKSWFPGADLPPAFDETEKHKSRSEKVTS